MSNKSNQNSKEEEWRTINEPGLEDYEISTTGRCRSWKVRGGRYVHAERPRKSSEPTPITAKRTDKYGNENPRYSLQKDTGNVTRPAKKLVAETFIPNPHGYKYIEHKDGDLSNCNVDNLRWTNDRSMSGLSHPPKPESQHSCKSDRSELEGLNNFASTVNHDDVVGPPPKEIKRKRKGSVGSLYER